MAIKFPQYQEIRLKNPPLAEVICQVRIPPILKILTSEPGDFQDSIRDRFPLLSIEQGFTLSIAQAGANTPAPNIQPRVYKFASEDGTSNAALTVDFFAISTTAYHHWDDFVRDLVLVYNAVAAAYKPAYATRIGLRYVNRLTSVNTGCRTMKQTLAMLRPQLTAQLRTDVWSEPSEAVTQLILADGSGILALRTAYRQDADTKIPFFVLDFDYFEEGKINLTDLVERCHQYHEKTYAAFRWCFKDISMSAFDPLE